MKIHSTVILEDNVNLGKNVSIGPFSIIRNGTSIGDNVTIGTHCVIGSKPDVINSNQFNELIINENVKINDSVIISLGYKSATVISKDTFIMNNSYIAHDVQIGERVIITGSVNILGNCFVDSEVYLGTNSTVHQNSSLEKLSVLAANSFAKGNLNAGIIYIGNPALPVKLNKRGFENSKLNIEELNQIEEKALEVIKSI